jgi:hypothetical protein
MKYPFDSSTYQLIKLLLVEYVRQHGGMKTLHYSYLKVQKCHAWREYLFNSIVMRVFKTTQLLSARKPHAEADYIRGTYVMIPKGVLKSAK